MKEWVLNWKIKVLGSVSIFCRWMTECDEKENVLYPSEKLILFLLLFDFWGCLNSVLKSDFSIQSERWIENGKHLQKTMHYTTKCDEAVAQVWVSFFYLPQRTEVIAFTIADAIPLQNTIFLILQHYILNNIRGISY